MKRRVGADAIRELAVAQRDVGLVRAVEPAQVLGPRLIDDALDMAARIADAA